MLRRLNLLNGFAIMAVVLNHTVYNRGFIELFSWLALKPMDPTAYFNGSGTIQYYLLISLTKLTLFSVPTFLLISGFFIAYACKGNQKISKWKVIKSRLISLLIPYLIWSLIIFFTNILQNGFEIEPIKMYLQKLILGLADPAYWFIPLLVQFYLLSPLLIIPLEKKQWKILLLISAFIHISTSMIAYLEHFGIEMPKLLRITATHGLFFRELLYFVTGMIIAYKIKEFKSWITQHRRTLLIITIVSGLLAIIEAVFIFEKVEYTIGFRESLITTLYIFAVMFTFLAFDNTIPWSKTINNISNKSYGIYLLHNQVQGAISLVIYHFIPFLLSIYIIYLPMLFISGLGIPYIFMNAIAKSRWRGAYRYLFG